MIMSDIQGKNCSTTFLYSSWKTLWHLLQGLKFQFSPCCRDTAVCWNSRVVDHESNDRFLCSYTHCSVRFNHFRMFHIICQQFELAVNTNFANTCSSMEV